MNPQRIRARSGAALATGVAAALALSALAATPATAAPVPAPGTSVSDAVFTWALNDETGNKSFSGDFNFLSAGKIAKSSASDKLTESEWLATSGNVTLQKKQSDGSYAASTWAGLSTDASGAAIANPNAGQTSGNRVSIAAGTGTVDADTDTADITWSGDFTVAFYGGLTQFSVSDPHLELANGAGTVTATLSGYGTSMSDPDAFGPLPDTQVTVADLTGVDVTATGFIADPEYLGVSVTTPAGASPQAKPADIWGSFPQSFVDFQGATGQSSYWYSSGLHDAGKIAAPIGVAFTADAPVEGPKVVVSKTQGLDPAGETITVTGTGFLPNPPETNGAGRPLSGFGGAYVTFGTFLDVWQPSQGAPSSARKALSSSTKWAVSASDLATIDPSGTAGGIVIAADGSFTTTMTVTKGFSGALADGNFGVYTYAGGGAKYAPFETYTPVTFAAPAVDRIDGADRYDVAVNVSKKAYPDGSDVAYVVTGTTFADALSAAPAAVKDHAPLLLTTPDALPAAVKAELARLTPDRVVIVGGPNSVSEGVQAELAALATKVERISGADRYEASRNVVEYAFGEKGAKSVYLATGANFPDALSASAAGGAKGIPVLLVNGGETTVDAPTTALLAKLHVESAWVAGGPNSVSEGILNAVAALPGPTTPAKNIVVTRLSGADRFAASISINNSAFSWANTVYLATGFNYPDALAGAALAGLKGAPLYVVPTDCVPQGVVADIDRLGAGRVTLLGGPNSLTPDVLALKACAF